MKNILIGLAIAGLIFAAAQNGFSHYGYSQNHNANHTQTGHCY